MSKTQTPTNQRHAAKIKAEHDNYCYNFLRIWKRRYSQMKGRHEGRATNASHAEGKGLLSLDEFLEWCKHPDNLDTFIVHWMDWANNNFKLFWAPSIDRIDPHKGYTVDNIQWMPFAENCRKNNKSPIDHQNEVWPEDIDF
jgi:hypothetical protein